VVVSVGVSGHAPLVLRTLNAVLMSAGMLLRLFVRKRFGIPVWP
jgi:hypothetical protein